MKDKIKMAETIKYSEKTYRHIKINNKIYLGKDGYKNRESDYVIEIFDDDYFNNKTVLDLGCASGAILFEIRNKIKKGSGIDVDFKKLNLGKQIVEEHKIENIILYENRLEKFLSKTEESYDCIFLLNVLHHVQAPYDILNMAAELSDDTICIEIPEKGFYDAYNSTSGVSDTFKGDDTIFVTIPTITAPITSTLVANTTWETEFPTVYPNVSVYDEAAALAGNLLLLYARYGDTITIDTSAVSTDIGTLTYEWRFTEGTKPYFDASMNEVLAPVDMTSLTMSDTGWADGYYGGVNYPLGYVEFDVLARATAGGVTNTEKLATVRIWKTDLPFMIKTKQWQFVGVAGANNDSTFPDVSSFTSDRANAIDAASGWLLAVPGDEITFNYPNPSIAARQPDGSYTLVDPLDYADSAITSSFDITRWENGVVFSLSDAQSEVEAGSSFIVGTTPVVSSHGSEYDGVIPLEKIDWAINGFTAYGTSMPFPWWYHDTDTPAIVHLEDEDAFNNFNHLDYQMPMPSINTGAGFLVSSTGDYNIDNGVVFTVDESLFADPNTPLTFAYNWKVIGATELAAHYTSGGTINTAPFLDGSTLAAEGGLTPTFTPGLDLVGFTLTVFVTATDSFGKEYGPYQSTIFPILDGTQ